MKGVELSFFSFSLSKDLLCLRSFRVTHYTQCLNNKSFAYFFLHFYRKLSLVYAVNKIKKSLFSAPFIAMIEGCWRCYWHLTVNRRLRPKAKCFLALKSPREKLSSRTNSITEIPLVGMQLTKWQNFSCINLLCMTNSITEIPEVRTQLTKWQNFSCSYLQPMTNSITEISKVRMQLTKSWNFSYSNLHHMANTLIKIPEIVMQLTKWQVTLGS